MQILSSLISPLSLLLPLPVVEASPIHHPWAKPAGLPNPEDTTTLLRTSQNHFWTTYDNIEHNAPLFTSSPPQGSSPDESSEVFKGSRGTLHQEVESTQIILSEVQDRDGELNDNYPPRPSPIHCIDEDSTTKTTLTSDSILRDKIHHSHGIPVGRDDYQAVPSRSTENENRYDCRRNRGRDPHGRFLHLSDGDDNNERVHPSTYFPDVIPDVDEFLTPWVVLLGMLCLALLSVVLVEISEFLWRRWRKARRGSWEVKQEKEAGFIEKSGKGHLNKEQGKDRKDGDGEFNGFVPWTMSEGRALIIGIDDS